LPEFVFEDKTLEVLLLNQADSEENTKIDLTLHSLDGKRNNIKKKLS